MNLFERAKKHIPGGVNSPVRAFQAVGGDPVFMDRGQGPFIFDNQGKRYIDYVASWGPLILGHAHPVVLAAVEQAVSKGLSFGTATAQEIECAELICHIMPAIEKVRLVNSGTEATMSAIRLARGFTGRSKIIKFEGCYHGHVDSLLVKAGSGALTFGKPTSSGVPENVVADTFVATFNDLDSVKAIFNQHPDIAAIIVEPIAGNMGCVPPIPGFLKGLRQLCDHHNTLLILDEVMTGFRVALGGAQALYNITPDLTTLGKIIGGGLPVGAFGGRSDIMDCLSPDGPVYQAGTLSGNPIAVAAGLANLTFLRDQNPYPTLAKMTTKLVDGLLAHAQDVEIDLRANQVGSMFGLFFNTQPQITSFDQVMASSAEHFKHFFHGMLANGVYLAPSAFESGFVSTAHDEAIITATLAAAEQTFAHMAEAITP